MPQPLLLWESLQRLQEQLPERVMPSVVGISQSEHIRNSYLRWRGMYPHLRSHVLTCHWQMPLAWLALFGSNSRHCQLHPQPMLVYRTRLSGAKRRLARAVRILGDSIDAPECEGIQKLSQWLGYFHPRALVELDVQGLASMLPLKHWVANPDDGKAQADSVTLWEHMLFALRAGDEALANLLYEQVVAPWNVIRAREHAN